MVNQELLQAIRKNFDEIEFLERFKITLDDLISSFSERIEDQADALEEEFCEDVGDIELAFGLTSEENQESES